MRLRVESESEFFHRIRSTVRKQPQASGALTGITLSFQSASTLLAVLTPKRHALFEAVRKVGQFESIEALAQAVSRDRAAVSKDLKALADAGLLHVQDVTFPGHGRRTRISPSASRIRVELTL